MNRLSALLLVLVLWAAIYLPGLGSPELKGEEGRRILPALTMLETGNYLVPFIGGEPYLRKPPLLNWAIAGAMRLTSTSNEWVARLPSVLSVLAVALTLVLVAGRPGWLGVPTALVAAVFFLTQVATIEKGRLAEIEAIYFGLSGVAIILWLAWWAQDQPPWLLWLVPSALLGLAMLAKGPAHLLFHYAIVLAVLWRAGEMKRLLHPAHFLGLLLAAGIFLLWEIPYSHTAAGRAAAEVWKAQSVGRLSGTFDFLGWAGNIPRGLSNHLPWLLLAPLLWRRDLEGLEPHERALLTGTRLAVVVTFFGLLLIPGMLPRYTLPLLAPFSMLLAYVVADERLAARPFALRLWWRSNVGLAVAIILGGLASPALYALGRQKAHADPARYPGHYSEQLELVLACSALALFMGLFVLVGRRKLARPSLLATASGVLIGGVVLLYTAVGLPWQNARDKLRPTALRIDATVPPGQVLTVFDPEFQPVLFYLQTPIVFARELEQIVPVEVKKVYESMPTADSASDEASAPPVLRLPWVLTRAEKLGKVQKERPEYEIAEDLGKANELVLLKPTGTPREPRRKKTEEATQDSPAPPVSTALPASPAPSAP